MCHLQVIPKLLLHLQHCTDSALLFIQENKSLLLHSQVRLSWDWKVSLVAIDSINSYETLWITFKPVHMTTLSSFPFNEVIDKGFFFRLRISSFLTLTDSDRIYLGKPWSLTLESITWIYHGLEVLVTSHYKVVFYFTTFTLNLAPLYLPQCLEHCVAILRYLSAFLTRLLASWGQGIRSSTSTI